MATCKNCSKVYVGKHECAQVGQAAPVPFDVEEFMAQPEITQLRAGIQLAIRMALRRVYG